MSHRAIKRYEESESMRNIPDNNSDSDANDSTSEQHNYVPQGANLFALLGEQEEDGDEDGDEKDETVSSMPTSPHTASPKELLNLTADVPEPTADEDSEPTKKKKKNRRRKKRNAINQRLDRDWIVLNEIEKERQEQQDATTPGWIPSSYFSAEDGDDVREEATKIMSIIEQMAASMQADDDDTQSSISLQSVKLLHVEPRLLNADSELKRLFGAKVVDSERRVEESAARRRGRGGGRSVRKKISLVSPRDTWFPEAPGLTMLFDADASEATHDVRYFRYVHESSYAQIQNEYRVLSGMHDPNMLVELVNRYPFHVDTLLQLAEVYRQMGELDRASEQIERCLYLLENSWNIAFKPFDGSCRLSFDILENRPLYIALFRYSQLLTRRGLHRTALEISKLLLNFEPGQDPMGMLMLADSFALLSKEYSWVLKMHEQYRLIPAQYFPNFAASSALAAEFLRQDASKSKKSAKSESEQGANDLGNIDPDALLTEALLTFPMLLRPLLSAIQNDSTVWTEHRLFDEAWYGAGYEDGGVLMRIARVYAERTKTLWNSSASKDMLIRCARAAGALDTAAGMGIDPQTGRSTSALVKDPSKDPRVAKCRALRAEAGEWFRNSGMYQSVQIADFADSTTNLPAELLAGDGADQPVGAPAPRNVTMAQGAMEFLQSLLPWREARDAEDSMQM